MTLFGLLHHYSSARYSCGVSENLQFVMEGFLSRIWNFAWWKYHMEMFSSIRRSEHTDRNVKLKSTVSFQNHPNSFRDYHYMALPQTFPYWNISWLVTLMVRRNKFIINCITFFLFLVYASQKSPIRWREQTFGWSKLFPKPIFYWKYTCGMWRILA